MSDPESSGPKRTAPQAVVPDTIVEEDTATEILRGSAERLTVYAAGPHPMPARGRRLDGFTYGLSLPVVALRALVRDERLRHTAILPVLVFTVVCAIGGGFAWLGEGWFAGLSTFGAMLVGASPISPIFFTRIYARLASQSRQTLGFTPREPYLRGYGQATVETFLQLILVGVGILPVALVVKLVPVLAVVWTAVLGALWAGHWIVVEALDSSRTLAPGQSAHELEAQADAITTEPWFSRMYHVGKDKPWGDILWPARMWGHFMSKLARRWRGEIDVMEKDPFVAAGLGTGAALVLAIPIVNLLFRPVVVIAAATWQAQLEIRDAELAGEEAASRSGEIGAQVAAPGSIERQVTPASGSQNE